MVRNLCTFSVIDLIESVEQRPCLWDKRRDDYKDKGLKEKSWREVCNTLYENFEDINEHEQRRIETAVGDKWRNIRDSFSKSLRKRPNDEVKRKYIYHDYLLFLRPIYDKEETSSTSDDISMELTDAYIDDTEIETDDKKILIEVQEKQPTPPPIPQTSKKRKVVIETDNLASSSSNGLQSPINEDQAFLWSLLPTMKKLNREDNFQFRIEVMQLLQKYKMQSRVQELESCLNNR